MKTFLVVLVTLGLAACTSPPMTPERAERECRRDARDADGVSGEVGIGIGTGGAGAGGKITVTDKVFNPQTEGEFMTECVARKLNGEPEPTTFGITIGANT